MSIFELYLLTRLDAINSGLTLVLVLSLTAAGFIFLFASMENCSFNTSEEDKVVDKMYKAAKKLVITGIIAGAIIMFIPTTKEVAVIYGLNYITNNEEAKKLPDNILKAVNKQLEEWQE